MLFKEVGSKLNWIDSNDTFVGYDTSVCCCEHADWFVADCIVDTYEGYSAITGSADAGQGDIEWDLYDFDRSFGIVFDNALDGGGIAVFLMLPKEGKAVKYLHLFNSHNGYYGHGFYSNTVIGNGGL